MKSDINRMAHGTSGTSGTSGTKLYATNATNVTYAKCQTIISRK